MTGEQRALAAVADERHYMTQLAHLAAGPDTPETRAKVRQIVNRLRGVQSFLETYRNDQVTGERPQRPKRNEFRYAPPTEFGVRRIVRKSTHFRTKEAHRIWYGPGRTW